MMDDAAIGMVAILFYIAIVAFFILIYWRIWSKAGYAGAWALLMLVPLVNIGALCYLAFAEWPVTKKVRELESKTFS
jgi:hypothetical protein